jgi:serine/threonine protein kinase
MPESATVTPCPTCQAPLDPRVLGGLCPRCMSDLVLGDTDAPAKGSGTGSGLPIGQLGDYELIEEIGRGGMGIVYRARQPSLERWVALKLMHSNRLPNRELEQRFLREARLAASLRHPGIVAIYDLGKIEGSPFFTMELVEGSNLEQLIDDGAVAPARAAELAMIVAQTVAFAHQRGVVHRDLKPSNVLLDLDGRPKVADFGLAKNLDGASLHDTQLGLLLGSPAHMAPEQAAGDTSGQPAVDIYGLGALLYHLLTGRAPHVGTTLPEVLRKVAEEPPLPPRALVPGIPEPIEAVVLRCLAKDPARRYASASEVAAELARFLGGQPVIAMGLKNSSSPFILDGANPRLRAYDLFLQALQLHDSRGLLAATLREVQDLLHEALRLDPRLARGHLLLCETHLAHYFIGFDPSESRLRRAEEALQAGERLGAEVSEIMRMRGFFLYWGKRDHAGAAAAFELAVRAMPNSADAHYSLALVHRRMGEWKRSIEGFQRAMTLDPRNPRIARETAFTLETLRDYAGALQVFGVQQRASPGDPDLQTHIAMAQLCLDGDLDRALTALAALPLDAEGIVASWRSWLAAWRGRPAEAIAWLPPLRARSGVELGEELLHHSRVRHAAGDPAWRPQAERARDALLPEVKDEHAGTAYPMMMLAMLEGMLGATADALRHADRAIELRPAHRDAVLGSAIAGAQLIRREPGRLFVFAYVGETERFFAELARLINTPSSIDPAILRLDPTFATLRNDPRFDAILATAQSPIVA